VNKLEAVHLVAARVAGNMLAGSIEESTGFTETDQDRMSAADRERLGDAIEVVADRLYRMGTAPREDVG
jgi:hypothetical protein